MGGLSADAGETSGEASAAIAGSVGAVGSSAAGLDVGAVLASITDLLDRIDHDRSKLSATRRLELVSAAQRVHQRVEALMLALLAEADTADAALQAAGTPSVSWLAGAANKSRRESARLMFQAKAVTSRDGVRDATLTGQISPGHARAINKVFDQLPETLTGAQTAAAEDLLLSMAARMPAADLEQTTSQVLVAVAPADAAEQDGLRLQRQAEQAYRNRALRFHDDHQGSILFSGCLPTTEGQQFLTQIRAWSESARRNALEARDPATPMLTLEQRQADALIDMLAAHARAKTAPGVGGDRPRVVVTIGHADLRRDLLHTGRIADGQQLSAGELRRLACDADILPAVLDGPSQVLDVGRDHRLVTPAIRAALTLRDKGCSYPTCDAPAARCDAHHILPWWDGGTTALNNLLLLCPHHHRLIEPAKYGAADQWQARIAPDGVPEFVPPKRLDPHQAPIRHHRYHQDPDPPDGR